MGISLIFASSEAAPYSKTGGLGDVAGALPAALSRLGCDVSLFLPLYRETRLKHIEIESTGTRIVVPLGRRMIRAEVFRAPRGPVKTFFISCDEFYDRSFLYGPPEGDYFDNLERFTLFSRAMLEAVSALGLDIDVLHANDWQTGLLPLYIKNLYRGEERFQSTATLFTIHNSAFQGLFPADDYSLLGLSHRLFTPAGLEFWGKISLLKAGLVSADIVTTVSPGYCREIKTARYGYGLEGLYKERKKDLYGVINGVDYSEWDPAIDPLLPAQYSPYDMTGKGECRKALLRTFGLKALESTAVVGMVTRLTGQKGIDIVIRALPELMKLDMTLVIVGTGDKEIEARLRKVSEKFQGRVGLKIAFDNTLAHLVEAGSDIFLMPSQYEPCGLNQIYSQKYGTIPVVRATGGLDDTVRDYTAEKNPTGFKFKRFAAPALATALGRAVEVFKDRKKWAELQQNAMREDFSWEVSARRYMELYGLAMERQGLGRDMRGKKVRMAKKAKKS
ncbi:MAG: glycogen synthase GlgA [Thermodesulfobacteriota bacterium]